MSIKSHKLLQLYIGKNQDPAVCSLHEKHFKYKKPNNLKIKEWKKIPQENSKHKKAGVAMLILNKVDFKVQNNG